MTRPHSTLPTNIDIRTVADQVNAQMRQGHAVEALRLLEEARRTERPVVQEALDRYVAAGSREELARLDSADPPPPLPTADTLQRLRLASTAPRMPDYSQVPQEPNELAGLTEAQKYDVYASMVETRGDQRARDALRSQDSVLLGLRRETSTIASMDANGERGRGVYDDHIVVLRTDGDGQRHWAMAGRASTEPTAQYDHHARPAPGRVDTVYANVYWRRAEGQDVDGDRINDLGRLAEGTIEMSATTHNNPIEAMTDTAFRPSTEQLTPPRVARLVERDSNGDGRFDLHDTNGVQDLNRTFKIHSGSRANTDSAGCQTIHPGDYEAFMQAATSQPGQTRWQYVLTSTTDAPARQQGQDLEQGGDRPPAQPPAAVDDHQGAHHPPPGPFHDIHADLSVAAAMRGDSNALDRLAEGYAHSTEGQQLARAGDHLLEQQQHMERQVAQSQDVPQMHVP